MITLKLHSLPYLASQTTLLGGGYFSVNQTYTTLKQGNLMVCACFFICNIYSPYLLTAVFGIIYRAEKKNRTEKCTVDISN